MKKLKIIATLSEEDLQKLQTLNIKGVDIFEIRLDLLSKNFLQKELVYYLEKLKKPLLFTYRLKEDSSLKSHFSLNVQDIQELIETFNSSKNYLDIDLKSKDFFLSFKKNLKYKKIYSLHNFSGTYSYAEMLCEIQKLGDKKGIYKFAVLPKNIKEGMEFLSYIKKLSKTYTVIGIWMGEMGSFSRIYGNKFGSSFTYATLTEPKAPGQVSVDLILKYNQLIN